MPGDVIFDMRALEVFYNLDTVEAVIYVASFPSSDIVAAAIIDFNDEFELESLVGYFLYRGVWNLSKPIMSFRPIHLDSSFAIFLIRVPITQQGWRTYEPNILSEISLIVTADSQLRKLDKVLAIDLSRCWNRADVP